MRHPWLLFLAALAGSAVVAAGFAVGVDQLLTTGGPAPRLNTVPASVLARSGYTLSPASVPPYCGALQAASTRGWLPEASGGCPISREDAIAVTPNAGGPVLETLLARVTASGHGRGRLEWLVVERFGAIAVPVPMYACPVPPASVPACGSLRPLATTEVVFVDAQSGRPLAALPVTSGGVQPVPFPVPSARPLPLPVRVPAPATAT